MFGEGRRNRTIRPATLLISKGQVGYSHPEGTSPLLLVESHGLQQPVMCNPLPKFCSVGPEGLEPSARGLKGRCSIQLSYKPVF